jgi:predicted CxxxxCH...CXXCH cytochrome family protein
MKKQISFYILFITSLAMMLAYHGCSELEDNLVKPETAGSHGAGWVTPSSNNFHGHYIAANKWNLNGCKTCHGANYLGGNTQVGCFDCHHDGPEACTTCHGGDGHANPPKGLHGETSDTSIHVGAHFTHLNDTARFSAFVQCNECHTPVNSFSDTNHIGPNPDGIAEINFGPLANTYLGEGVYPDPQWNESTASCSGTYCHGSFKGGNVNNIVTWTQPGGASCGTCHSLPPTFRHDPSWIITRCGECHSATMDNGQTEITHPEKHVNGVINYGR